MCTVFGVVVITALFTSACGKQSAKQVNSTDNEKQSSSSEQQSQSGNSHTPQQDQSINVGTCSTVNYEPVSLPGNGDNSVKIALMSATLPDGPIFSPAGTGCNLSASLQATYALKPVDSSRTNKDADPSSKPDLYLSYQLVVSSSGGVVRTIEGKEKVPSLSPGGGNKNPQPRIYITVSTQWDGKDTDGNELADGVYSYVINAQFIKVTKNDTIIVGEAQVASGCFVIDTTPPTITVESPQSKIYDTRTLPITIHYSDNLSGVDTSTLHVIANGTDITSRLTIGQDSAALSSYLFQECSNTIEVRLSDKACNPTTTSLSFTSVTTPPQVSVVDPANGQIAYSMKPQIALSMTDACPGVTITSITGDVDGRALSCTALSFSTAACNFTSGSLSTCKFFTTTASISDSVGNIGQTTSTFMVSEAVTVTLVAKTAKYYAEKEFGTVTYGWSKLYSDFAGHPAVYESVFKKGSGPITDETTLMQEYKDGTIDPNDYVTVVTGASNGFGTAIIIDNYLPMCITGMKRLEDGLAAQGYTSVVPEQFYFTNDMYFWVKIQGIGTFNLGDLQKITDTTEQLYHTAETSALYHSATTIQTIEDACTINEDEWNGYAANATDSSNYIPGVPFYFWHKGCGPTAAAMVLGYWDYPYEGPSPVHCNLNMPPGPIYGRIMDDDTATVPTAYDSVNNTCQQNYCENWDGGDCTNQEISWEYGPDIPTVNSLIEDLAGWMPSNCNIDSGCPTWPWDIKSGMATLTNDPTNQRGYSFTIFEKALTYIYP